MRAARPFLIMLAMVVGITGGAVLVSVLSQDEEEYDPDACGTELVMVDVGGTPVALDDQAAIGADTCDLRRRGPTPTIPFAGYDCRIVLPDGYRGPPLPDRIEPTHEAGTCRQGDAPRQTSTPP